MDRTNIYYKQVQLLLQVIPFVARHDCFALKGGTAINLFVRDFPRLSVDIDLVFLPLLERTEALSAIRVALNSICAELVAALPDIVLIKSFLDRDDALRVLVSRNAVQIKIELSPVLRGTVFNPQVLPVHSVVEDEFGYAEMNVVAHADLYAGKICAALDRQHPRDLFDVKHVLDTEGMADDLRKAVIVYIASHNRPMAELLRPKFKDISGVYHGEFLTMTEQAVSLSDLESTRVQLVDLLNASLTRDERAFLLSFKERKPVWSLLGLPGVENLPAIRWKQTNLAKMSPDKHKQACDLLRHVLEV